MKSWVCLGYYNSHRSRIVVRLHGESTSTVIRYSSSTSTSQRKGLCHKHVVHVGSENVDTGEQKIIEAPESK